MTLPNLLTLTLGPVPWLVGGLILLGFSLLVPRPTIVSLGFAGMITALVALSVPLFPSQLLIWGVLSGGFTLILRGLVPQESKALEPARYARVCEPIVPGGIGHVHYEGAIWQARCQISDVAIASDLSVVVVERQGNTLIVLPIPTSQSGLR
ncbi:MAG: NfeD family protein [Leptolyngbya sp. SIO1E4]|nr:NfeD family protein [Leptolyngbya sp. SIO1E4]